MIGRIWVLSLSYSWTRTQNRVSQNTTQKLVRLTHLSEALCSCNTRWQTLILWMKNLNHSHFLLKLDTMKFDENEIWRTAGDHFRTTTIGDKIIVDSNQLTTIGNTLISMIIVLKEIKHLWMYREPSIVWSRRTF